MDLPRLPGSWACTDWPGGSGRGCVRVCVCARTHAYTGAEGEVALGLLQFRGVRGSENS